MKYFLKVILPNLLRIGITVFLIYKASADLNLATILLLILFVIYCEGQNYIDKKYIKQIVGIKEVIATIIEVLDNHKEGVELLMKIELLKKNPYFAEYIKKSDIKDTNTQ